MQKKVLSIHKAHEPHMVGDGLPVRNIFSYTDLGRSELSPFLMLDYGSPVHFPPTKKVLGVGMHPHRGFETVTVVFQGRLAHRDTAGNHGEIGPGDVQWMTAGAGVLHEELHAPEFRKSGGMLQMAQLWVNLPAKHKMTKPNYQTLLKDQIPVVQKKDSGTSVRVVAGSFEDAAGPAHTFTPVNLWDVLIETDRPFTFSVPSEFTTALFVVAGSATINGHKATATDLVRLGQEGSEITLTADGAAQLLLLNGEPIEEPVVGYGPFVMNSQAEIVQAWSDFQNGTLG
jgi:hypothetical protein